MSFVQETCFSPTTSFPSDSLPGSNSQRESLLYDDSITVECPICNETMLYLVLNQHLDDAHSEEPNAKKDILNWLKNAQSTIMKPLTKAKLASLPNQLSQTVINKLNELDPLDENSELVTRIHWQKDSDNDLCSHSNCGKTVNLRNGKHNCRKYVDILSRKFSLAAFFMLYLCMLFTFLMNTLYLILCRHVYLPVFILNVDAGSCSVRPTVIYK
jgi:hypothetical protein